jgi:predicted metal-dependent hydrolase
MKARNPQLALRLDAAAPDPGSRWREGAPLAYLGGAVTLRLGTEYKEAVLDNGELHLPLPPAAGPRQIQDAAESWLRAQAHGVIGAQLTSEARRRGRPVPAFTLSFAARAGWVQVDAKGGLRFQWRLVEQTPAVIAQVVVRALAALPAPGAIEDLFALSA